MLIFECGYTSVISIKREKRFYSSDKLEDDDTETILFSGLAAIERLEFVYSFINQHFYVNLEIRNRDQIPKIREKINKSENGEILLSIGQFNYKLKLGDNKYGRYVSYPGFFNFKSIDKFDYNIFTSIKESIENKTFKTNSISLYTIDNKNIQ